jgi:hypothetical protein
MATPTIEEYIAGYRERESHKPRQQSDTMRYRLGPEHPGCINSGARPCLMSWKVDGLTYWFAGPEEALRDARRRLFWGNKREEGKGNRRVIMRKSRAAAERYFFALCSIVLDSYREAEKIHAQAQALRAKGDPESLLAAANLLYDL